MHELFEFATAAADMLFGHAELSVILAFAIVSLTGYGNLTDALLARARMWHGSVADRFSNINTLVDTLRDRQEVWKMPEAQLTDLINSRNQLDVLIKLCAGSAGSQNSRMERNTLLDVAVWKCVREVKPWAIGLYGKGTMAADDFHELGFLIPGETSGHHSRSEPTKALAEVKVRVVNGDIIDVVVDQSANKDAGPVRHGWPRGVHSVLIVVTEAGGEKKEALRHPSTKLHNRIEMPAGSRGKQFVIKAAFLKHPDDIPVFGNEPTFSMPLTTEDLTTLEDQQHYEDYELMKRDLEQRRQEIELLQAELDRQKGLNNA
jgi:hypothetical protein